MELPITYQLTVRLCNHGLFFSHFDESYFLIFEVDSLPAVLTEIIVIRVRVKDVMDSFLGNATRMTLRLRKSEIYPK